MVLGLDFGLPEYAATALDFLQHDPDVYCRLTGANVVGALRANSGDADLLAALARVVRSTGEDRWVRTSSYAAMLAILAYDPRQQFALSTSRFRFPEDVDWSLVDRFLPSPLRPLACDLLPVPAAGKQESSRVVSSGMRSRWQSATEGGDSRCHTGITAAPAVRRLPVGMREAIRVR